MPATEVSLILYHLLVGTGTTVILKRKEPSSESNLLYRPIDLKASSRDNKKACSTVTIKNFRVSDPFLDHRLVLAQ